jgi:ribosome-binding protein aMBF1 (putative translation factor)
MDETMCKLNSYFKQLEEANSKVPRYMGVRKPHFKAISAAAGVDVKLLTEHRYQNRIALAVEELGLAPRSRARLPMLRERSAALLSAYLQDLADKGLKLPEDPRKTGTVFLSQVEAEAGIDTYQLACGKAGERRQDDSALIKMIEDAARVLGVEQRILRTPSYPADSRITYGELLRNGAAARQHELKERGHARQQLYNTRSALRYFLKTLALDESNLVGSELSHEFESSLDEVFKTCRKATRRKKLQTELRWWRNYYRKLLNTSGLPQDINGAIACLVDASGLSINPLAKLIGTRYSALERWYKGLAVPNLLSAPALSKMEELFKLSSGTLIDRIPEWNRKWHLRYSQLPAFLLDEPKLARRVLRHLPGDFCSRTDDEQREIVSDIEQHILSHNDDYTRRIIVLRRLKYKLTDVPTRLAEELEDLCSFKTSERAPLGMRRNLKWRPTTKKKRGGDLASFFGALRLPADADDPRLRGLGFAPGDLTMALIACPLVVDWYMRFRGEARTLYSEYHIDLLGWFQELLRPATGWLRQRPQLASRLVPLSLEDGVIISPEFVAGANQDWGRVCDKAVEEYKLLATEIRSSVKLCRDPFARIEGIVEMDEPMDAIEMLVGGMRKHWPNPRTAPARYHLAVRDCAMVLLMGLTGFRRLTVSQLDYTGDKSGHLSLAGEKYVLNVPRHLFKEENSPFFGPPNAQTDYFMEVPDVYGFNEVMSIYLNESRPWILQRYHPNSTAQVLFVSGFGAKSMRLTPAIISRQYAEATELHLVENKWRGTGLPKVGRHSPHSTRHIRGTAIIKKTGSFQLAGDANHNSEKTARKHYARFATKDRTSRVNDVLFGER